MSKYNYSNITTVQHSTGYKQVMKQFCAIIELHCIMFMTVVHLLHLLISTDLQTRLTAS